MEPLPNPDHHARRVGALLSLPGPFQDRRPAQHLLAASLVRSSCPSHRCSDSHRDTGGNGLRRPDPQSLKGAATTRRSDVWMLDHDREHSVRTLQLYLTPAEASALSDKLRLLLVDPEGDEHDQVLSDDASRDLSFSVITSNKLRDS